MKKLLMARICFRIFTENNPAQGDRKIYNNPDVNWLKGKYRIGNVGKTASLKFGMPWSSGLMHRICVLMADLSECGFESNHGACVLE